MKRFVLLSAAAILTLGSVAALADALVVTDEERLEAFVEAVTGDVTNTRIDGALGYADPGRVEVEVVAGDGFYVYGDGEEVDLAEHTRDALAPIEGEEARLVQDTIHIEGDDAHVALRVSTSQGMVDAQFRLVRRGDGWLIRQVRVL